MITDEAMKEAIERIGLTPDGEMLYRYLRKRLEEVDRSGEVRALRVENGQRIFASELMDLLSKGLEESARIRRSDTVVIEHARKPSAAGSDTGGRRGLAGLLVKRPDLREYPPDADEPRGPYGFGQT